MSEIAIRVENLSKRYRIGLKEEIPETFVEAATNFITAPIRNFRQLRALSSFENGRQETGDGRLEAGNPVSCPQSSVTPSDVIWALKDVSFEVKRGEVVGIIGRNGAGKSTLLKILSRITHPTSGRVELNGRVSSLLEVGTGFHSELTGRENIYLNGTILGMTKAEVDRKFDEIVDFSGVEKFIDTPVKRYSSGMRVRLAFSVAAHLEPEILLVDEVLAVGDAAFQKKCLGKMKDVTKLGRTVLFVSHNMAAIESLCQRTLVLNHGVVSYLGDQREAIARYLQGCTANRVSLKEVRRTGSGELRVVNIRFQDDNGHSLKTLRSGEPINILLDYEANSSYSGGPVHVGLTFRTQLGVTVFSQSTRMTGTNLGQVPPSGTFVCYLPTLPLPAATYHLSYNVKVNESYADAIDGAVNLKVAEGDFFGSGRVPSIQLGVCLVNGKWQLKTHLMDSKVKN